MNNYIKSTTFFNSGYIPEDSNSKRIKQGLDSQFISNSCVSCMTRTKQKDLKSFNTLYYPVKATPLPTYGLNPIPVDSPCVRYIQQP
jgi:hypothetical protein